MKVLLIEDNSQNIEALKQAILTAYPEANITVLTELGADFYEYRRGQYNQAMELSSYDAVITDVNMPGYTDCDGMIMSPVGPIIALKALQQGVKRIVVLTDANHHEPNPVSKAADLFGLISRGDGDCIIGDVKFTYQNVSKTDLDWTTKVMRWLFSEGHQRLIEWVKANP